MPVRYQNGDIIIHHGDCRDVLPTLDAESVNCCVTSPPYWGLRDYGVAGQIGLESTPEEYVATLVDVLREVRRVLRDNGTLWLNLGDTYAGGGRGGNPEESPFQKQATNRGSVRTPTPVPRGLKPKDLIGIPWRVAFALQEDGWWLRSDIIWSKPNPMPESVTDRPTKAHEYIFLMSKSKQYHYDADAIKEPITASGTRNKRSVWNVATQSYKGAHYATFPPKLILPCILAGCPSGGTVLDPFAGTGTTAQVARKCGCKFVGCELNEEDFRIISERLRQEVLF